MRVLEEAIRKEIVKFSLSEKPGDMVPYLKMQLTESHTTAEALFNYSRDYQFTKKPGKPFVINPAIINMLGVMVSNLTDVEQAKWRVQFYKLAADRGSSWGNRNYATCTLDKSPSEALTYAKKAVELAKDIPTEQHEHKFILCEAMRENEEYSNSEANSALMEYFEFKSKQLASTKHSARKEKIEKEIQQALILCRTILTEFQTCFDGTDYDPEYWQDNLTELEPFIKCTVTDKEYLIIKDQALFIKAQCHEKLEDYSSAMLTYCSITNKESPDYIQAIAARAHLIKEQVKRDSENENVPSEEKLSPLMLPNNVPLPTKFDAFWRKEAEWFHSVDENKMKKEFDKRSTQIDQLISGKEVELSLIEESLKNSEDSDAETNSPDGLMKTRKIIIDEELKRLKEIKIKLEQKYEKHSPAHRKTFRRHAAESRFFNPKRSKKRSELISLADELIDHRFKSTDREPDPINLTGKSTRLLITAEKAFQQAAINLTDKDNPQLGIPTAREKSWTVGDYWNQRSGTTGYGPIEHYKIDDTDITSEHRTSPKRQRLGDSFLAQHGTYSGDIYSFLSKLSSKEHNKEKQLATFMIRYGKNHQGVTLKELQAVYKDAEKKDVDQFNRVCFLIMAKEQVQWLSATDEDFHLGMAVAQARCLIMIEAGFITFAEAFKNNALFGIYSHTEIVNNPSQVAESCEYIDGLYMRYLQNKNFENCFDFLKKQITNKTPSTCLLTREQAHQDLKYVHGGDSDTDDEGYDTDLSLSS